MGRKALSVEGTRISILVDHESYRWLSDKAIKMGLSPSSIGYAVRDVIHGAMRCECAADATTDGASGTDGDKGADDGGKGADADATAVGAPGHGWGSSTIDRIMQAG